MSLRERALTAYTDGRDSQFSLSCAALPRVGEGAAAKLEGECIRLAQGQQSARLRGSASSAALFLKSGGAAVIIQ